MNLRLLTLLVASSLVLVACGKSENKPADKAPAATAQAPAQSSAPKAAAKAEDPEALWNQKVNKYIDVNNRVSRYLQHGKGTFAKFELENDAKVKKGDFKAIRTDTHYFDDYFVKSLKEAIAVPTSIPEVDAAAQELLAAVDKYIPNWKALEDYNKSKKYEDDKGAKGSQMLPMYVEGVDKLTQTIKTFSDKVDVVAQQAHEKRLAKYKAEGKLLEMYSLESTGAAREMLDLFSSAKDFKDPAKIEKANALLEKMETSVANMKTEHAKRKAEAPKSLPLIDQYDSIAKSLTELAGHYREARKNPEKFNDAIKAYNSAIDDMNRMR